MSKNFESVEERRAYVNNHAKVTRQRGRAKEYACELCNDKNAAEWAHTHSTDAADPKNYRPMCRTCHHKYDDRWNAEERKKVSDTLKSKGIVPPSALGLERTQETRDKMSNAQLARYRRSSCDT